MSRADDSRLAILQLARDLEGVTAALLAVGEGQPYDFENPSNALDRFRTLVGFAAERSDDFGRWSWDQCMTLIPDGLRCHGCGYLCFHAVLDERGLCPHCLEQDKVAAEVQRERDMEAQVEAEADALNPRCERCGGPTRWVDNSDESGEDHYFECSSGCDDPEEEEGEAEAYVTATFRGGQFQGHDLHDPFAE